MSLGRAKARGERGSWFARVEGRRLPCIHDRWVKGARYFDPGYVAGAKQWDEFVNALRNDRLAILTKGNWREDPDNKAGVAVERTGYVGIYEIADVETTDEGLSFNFVSRIKDLVTR